jgi:hypothetical protein
MENPNEIHRSDTFLKSSAKVLELLLQTTSTGVLIGTRL